MLPGGRVALPNVSQQDILPFHFPDGTRIECSPNEKELHQALRTGNPHNILKALMSLVRFDGFDYYSKVLKTIPRSAFSEILRCLDPKYFLNRYQSLHKEISPESAKILGVPITHRSGYHPFFTTFLSQIHGIMKARQRDHPLSLSDYKYLLKCARSTGNARMARDVWMSMTAVSKFGFTEPIIPDGECFNLYIGTLTWSDTMNPFHKNRLRVIPDNFAPRAWRNPPYTLRGHRVGPDNGIKIHVSQIFRQMVKAGVPGDEETFCLMMLAFAREADLTSVGSTLRRVWGIDVDALMVMTDESLLEPVKRYSLDSPFYPTKTLLHTISHAYGINNDLSTALRLVDYISRQYNIDIPLSVWNELLQWTFVLSKNRWGVRVEGDGTTIGNLPHEAVGNIWATMTSEPYNIRPTMEMYDLQISNLCNRQRFGEMKAVMQEARLLHREHTNKLSRAHILLRTTLQPGHPVSEKRMRDVQFLRMRVTRNREYMKKWLRHLIQRASKSLKYDSNFSARDLPQILREWKLYIPKRVDYTIATGHVRFWTDVVVDNAIAQRKWRVSYPAREKAFKNSVRRGFKERDQRVGVTGWEKRIGTGTVDQE